MSIPGTTLLRSWWVVALVSMTGACTSQVTDDNGSPTIDADDALEVQPLDQQFVVAPEGAPNVDGAITEAPTGFDGLTNGSATQEEMLFAEELFAELEEIDEGLGPLFNARGCAACHETPITGATSQVTEVRAGHFNGREFIEHPGGSLINDQSITPAIQEHIQPGNEVIALRATTNLLGAGFIEAIDSNTLANIANNQPPRQRGLVIQVEVLEVPGAVRVGRFGWKNQIATLLTFSGDAYLNEMGITTPLFPSENTNAGVSVAEFDEVADPEDDGADIEFFSQFIRATKAPPRDEALAATEEAQNGSALFEEIGCATCHVPDIVTAPAGTVINGGALVVSEALGDKLIHPFSDFLLHDIDTGDGIVQNGGPASRNRLRTPALWGLRTRGRLMHDAASLTLTDAIARHGNQAAAARRAFNELDDDEQADVLTFLNSL